MSALDFVTILYPIPYATHGEQDYETKDMKLWGDYLIDANGQLWRKEYPNEYEIDTYTGKFDAVGGKTGWFTLTFENGKLRSWVQVCAEPIYVLTSHEYNHEDPDEYDVVDVYTDLDFAKSQITVGEWVECDCTDHSWETKYQGTRWTITPMGLTRSGEVEDSG